MAMNPNYPGSLEDQLAELRLRVLRLEQLLRTQGFVVEKTDATHPPEPVPLAGPAVVPSVPLAEAPLQASYPAAAFSTPVAPPLFGHLEQGAQRDTRSLESRIGSQ